MKNLEGFQGDLFALPVFEPVKSLIDDAGNPSIVLIGCGRHKKKSPTRAENLYTSTRFNISKEIASNIGARYFVLSAKHGLLEPAQVIEPYDVDISRLNEQEVIDWSEGVLNYIFSVSPEATVTVLAEEQYALPLIECNSRLGFNLKLDTPFVGLATENLQLWLQQARRASLRIRDLKGLYQYIQLCRENGLTFKFSELPNKKLEKRGVYVFLDPRELNFLKDGPRIVRVGTHAVSSESKSTLRNRLRSHFGQADGSGNHRGSIFRLHVGRALLESGDLSFNSDTWGAGQHATAKIREAEVNLEQIVSAYLGVLEVFLIPISDEPSKDSLRAHVETQLIALCTENFHTIDTPEDAWLGRFSPMSTIVKSGLWNLRDVAKEYNPSGLGSVAHLISMLESHK
ncbi:DUF6884 domain-containing protein [Pseudomonas gingeri]